MAGLIHFLADIYILLIIVRAVLSWFPHNPYHPAIKLIYQATEPPLSLIRRYLPSFAGLDLSPIVLIFAVYILEHLLIRIF